MESPIQAVQSPYYGGDSYTREPPPDLASLLLKERIVYLALPLFAEVTELIIAQLLYLQFDDPEKPIRFYVNSDGTANFETDAFAICDTLQFIKPPVHTICLGKAVGTAAMILSSGAKGFRASLPNATIVLNQPYSGTRLTQASNIEILAKEVHLNKAAMLATLARNTGQSIEKIAKDTDRIFYMTPVEAKEYGLIDIVLESSKDIPMASALAASVS
jgi:ATP-dependent Clp protease, protease subunit